jgi:hypothetical protein
VAAWCHRRRRRESEVANAVDDAFVAVGGLFDSLKAASGIVDLKTVQQLQAGRNLVVVRLTPARAVHRLLEVKIELDGSQPVHGPHYANCQRDAGCAASGISRP